MMNPVMPSVGIMLGTAGAAMVNDLNKPILVAGKGNGFILRYPVYLDRLAKGQGPLPDEMKVSLLESSLPAGGQAEVQRRQEQFLRGTGPPSVTRTSGTG